MTSFPYSSPEVERPIGPDFDDLYLGGYSNGSNETHDLLAKQEMPPFSPVPHRGVLVPKRATIISLTSIIVGIVLALSLSVGHHLFLAYLQGKNVEDFSQIWVKNASNAFASIFAAFLGFSVTSAL